MKKPATRILSSASWSSVFHIRNRLTQCGDILLGRIDWNLAPGCDYHRIPDTSVRFLHLPSDRQRGSLQQIGNGVEIRRKNHLRTDLLTDHLDINQMIDVEDLDAKLLDVRQ